MAVKHDGYTVWVLSRVPMPNQFTLDITAVTIHTTCFNIIKAAVSSRTSGRATCYSKAVLRHAFRRSVRANEQPDKTWHLITCSRQATAPVLPCTSPFVLLLCKQNTLHLLCTFVTLTATSTNQHWSLYRGGGGGLTSNSWTDLMKSSAWVLVVTEDGPSDQWRPKQIKRAALVSEHCWVSEWVTERLSERWITECVWQRVREEVNDSKRGRIGNYTANGKQRHLYVFLTKGKRAPWT
jgi:hypothetical protein